MALALLVSGCAPAQKSSGGGVVVASAGGNGSTYDGKYFVAADFTGQCADGIRARILVTDDGKAYSTRENCLDLTPPYKELDPRTFHSLSADSTVVLHNGIYELELGTLETVPNRVCRGTYMGVITTEVVIRARKQNPSELWARIGYHVRGFGSLRFTDASVSKAQDSDGTIRYALTPITVPPPQELLTEDAERYNSFVVGTFKSFSFTVYAPTSDKALAGVAANVKAEPNENSTLWTLIYGANPGLTHAIDLTECYSR